ncbi:hypothetical protein [Hyphomicrobium sp. LHD-15]|uniref:hypothetical protein n=1 Tax=Hyphomicrobium sp. LHD-15 TaxID=3072142 RepID=UPI00280D303A|nr:hypothetical protein [Hyphomicrobium sp. LHD-15]MDQ8699751.1 hypothetical protein [Hyphomicrobium sp. LHD-15]
MTTNEPQRASRLTVIVGCLAAIFVVVGALVYGISTESLQRQWEHLTGRASGPMTFRFFLQPAMAAVAALHDGVKDARLGRSPYFWTVLTQSGKRGERISEGLNATARIILIGIGMDLIYQLKVFGTFYPMEALLIALTLAFVPYLLLRGPVARIARVWLFPSSGGSTP